MTHGEQHYGLTPLDGFRSGGGKLNFYLLCPEGRVGGFEHEHCLDARTNILAGTWYLKKLLKRYQQTDDPVPYALADYNAGRGNVLKWFNGPGATNSAAFLEQIAFPGTKEYVQSVMRQREKYGSISTN